ncbi:TetR/AcrR family transcriptional regulator [Phaeobacter sp. 22II1-1F12B]|uniref:TetR/AcrR family transcriptional regulator n=1 Tax=Phaeobacter sp. 22II1-1F12B TaxID=1317111 RepID=UPI001303D4C8|nr:TetR/AcrR family transcriptional regulator [Phaeobacter sp. 22II1-1F12B]
MKISLREKRRRQTALDIQRATLDLAREYGFDQVTTDAIAERAGVSTRTFFNYYTNKEAASVGHPLGLPEEAKRAFEAGNRLLSEDLRNLMAAHLEQIEDMQDIMQDMIRLARDHDRVKRLLDQFLAGLVEELKASLALRMPDAPDDLRRVLADWVLTGLGHAITDWVGSDHMSLQAAFKREWEVQSRVAEILLESRDG